MNEADEWGRVVEGLRADLLLLEANPLDDVANVKRRIGVIVRGEWLTEAELQELIAPFASGPVAASGRRIDPRIPVVLDHF